MFTTYSPTRSSNLRRSLATVVFSLLLAFGVQQAKGSHIAGSDLTYQSLGNGSYLVTYTMYRDCDGITAPTTAFLNVASSSCNIASQSVQMTQVPNTGQEITPTCSTTVSTCNGGTSPGIQQYTYTALISMNTPCPDWHMWVDDCCRNSGITTLQNSASEGLYIEAYLNNTLSQNSSPVFNNIPIVFFCIGQTNYFNHGAVDADGDSLAFYFIAPRNSENDPVVYATNYSIAAPVTSSPAVTIDGATGDVAVTPTQSEVGLMSVMVEEYRNGELIGRVMRDIQVYTVACSNTLPALSGVNGTTTMTTSACVGGQPLCFNINSSDNNSNDSLWLTWNQGIPGATFSPGTGNRPVGQFCWSPTPADARPNPYLFTVTVHDNACPSPGVQTYSYQIFVSALQVQVVATPSVPCYGDQTGSASVSAAGIAPFTYAWSNGDVTSSVSSLSAGSYSVTVTDGTGCQGSQSFTISQPPALTLAMSGTNSQCQGGPGSATASVQGGTGPYTYAWGGGQTTSSISNLSPGSYTVDVVDANGCDISGSVQVSGSAAVVASLAVVSSTCGSSNGEITVNVSSGTAPYSYAWSPNVSTGATATGLTTGNYSVTITDANGCTTSQSASIGSSSIQLAVSNVVDAVCGQSNGEATVAGSGGTGGYTYMWMPGMYNTATVTGLAAGTYDVQVTDTAGCSAYVTVTVNNTGQIPVVTLPNFTAACGSTRVPLTGGSPSGGTYSGTGVINNEFDPTGLAGGTYVITYTVTTTGGCTGSATSTITVGSPATVTITSSAISCGSFTYISGGSPITLTANATSAGLSYQWYYNGTAISGATGSTYDATQNGTYSVNVFDATGCTNATATYTLNAVDVRCGHNMQKVVLCHVPPGRPSNPQTLCIAPSAIPAHLANHPGDCLGPCPTPRTGATATEITSLSVYPNPSNGILNVTFDLDADQNVSIALYDIEGRKVVTLLDEVYPGGYHISEEFNISMVPDGVYVLRYESGETVEYQRVTKTH
jgi:hypothetical protein